VPDLATTTGIILNRRPWSESSEIVTILTPDLGRIGAMARGSKRQKSGVGPALEPITESQIVVSLSTTGGLSHIRSAEVQEYFARAKSSLVRVALASAVCELAARALPEDEPNPAAYTHVRLSLSRIDVSEDRDAVNWLWWGILAIVGDIGYGFDAASCIHCGNVDTPHRWFSPAEGGPICGNCTGENLRAWMPDTQEALSWILTAPEADIASRRLSKRVNNDIRELLEDYLRYHVPHFDHFRSLDLLTPLT
jgi:DNA repair protein RecO (recombination protein O)